MAEMARHIDRQAARLLALLLEKRQKIAFAESCTGGMLAAALTAQAGASEVLEMSFVTYCDRAKNLLLGVPAEDLAAYTAVSHQVAAAMARGAWIRSGADIAVSVTGIAGPGGGTAEQPVGLVYLGIAAGDEVRVARCHFPGGRNAVREQATLTGLRMAIRQLAESAE
jgi:PncC family amidohydrolase